LKIIDTHMHFGECKITGFKISEEELVKYIESYKVTAVIVQPFPGCPDFVATHNEIFKLGRKYQGRVLGLSSVNPFFEEEFVRKELERTLGELGFVGIKIHTATHAISPTHPRATLIFDIAKKYKVPVMIHTGPGPFSDPALVAPRAEEYPDVKIILAHAGFGIYANTALLLAKKYENIYLETSWSYVYDLDAFIKSIPDKVLFGTDLIENAPVEYAKLDGLRISDELREKILYLNAKNVFNLKI